MAQKYRNIGGVEASAALASLTDGDGAYMDFDTDTGYARFGAKGGAGANRGILIRTLLAGVAVVALSLAPDGTLSGQTAVFDRAGAGGAVVTVTNDTAPAFTEYYKSNYGARVSVGALGSIEANLSFNMDYSSTAHRLYDTTMSATWLAIGNLTTALQYAPAYAGAGDVWQHGGYLYNLEINNATGGITTRGSLLVGAGAGTGDPTPPVTAYGFEIRNPPLSGVNQYGFVAGAKFSSAATAGGRAIAAQVITAAASFTMALGIALEIEDASKGAGSSITTQYGIKILDLTAGATNYAIFTGTGITSLGDVLELRAAATARTSTLIGLGGTTQTTVGANGAASALTALPLGYLIGYKGTTKIAIPYYNG